MEGIGLDALFYKSVGERECSKRVLANCKEGTTLVLGAHCKEVSVASVQQDIGNSTLICLTRKDAVNNTSATGFKRGGGADRGSVKKNDGDIAVA